MTDTDKIVVTIALVIAFAAIAFALGILVRRLTDAGRQSLLGSPAAMGPIGFVRF